MGKKNRFSLDKIRREMPDYQKLQLGQAAGQVLSYVATPLGLIMTKKFKPELLKKISDTLKKYFVIPHIGMLEPIIGAFLLSDEDKEAWNELKTRPVTERAEFISSNMSKYVIGTAVSIGSSFGTKIAMDKLLKSSGEWGLIFKSSGVDVSAKLGTIATMSTLLSKQTNKAKSGITKILQKMGMEKEDASDVAMAALFVGIPDTVGFFSANYYIKREGLGNAR